MRRCSWMPLVPTGRRLLARPGPARGREPMPPLVFAPALNRRRVRLLGFVPPATFVVPWLPVAIAGAGHRPSRRALAMSTRDARSWANAVTAGAFRAPRKSRAHCPPSPCANSKTAAGRSGPCACGVDHRTGCPRVLCPRVSDLFLVDTPIDTDHVRGVQGRYFVIALPVAAVFIAALVNCELPRRVPAAIAIAGSMIAGITTVEAVLRPHW